MDPGYGAQYAELYRHHWWWRAREDVIMHEVRRLRAGQAPGSFLDVGCGDALLFERLAGFGTTEGVEPDAGLVSEASRTRYQIHIGQFDESYQARGEFDIIFFLDVLEHLNDPVAALRRAVHLLAPAGVVLITVPAYRWLWTRHDDLNHHHRRYSRADVRILAQAAGCEVRNLRHLFQWLVLAKLGVRLGERLTSHPPRAPTVPRAGLNAMLLRICRIEQRVARLTHPPCGSSILAVLSPHAKP